MAQHLPFGHISTKFLETDSTVSEGEHSISTLTPSLLAKINLIFNAETSPTSVGELDEVDFALLSTVI